MKLWLKIVIGLSAGVVTGFLLGDKVGVVERIGSSFIDLLKMVVGLLVFCSLVTGISHIGNTKLLGRIGLRALSFYLLTTVASLFFALLCAFVMKPGVGLHLTLPSSHLLSYQQGGVLDFLFGIIPSNPFGAFTEGNIFQIMLFSLFFALALIFSKEKGKPILELLESLGEVVHSLIHVVMRFAPYGVFALVAATVGSTGFALLGKLVKFLACHCIVSLLQVFFVFGFAIRYLAKVRIIPFFKGMKEAIVMALTTGSGAATLPISLECARHHLGISADIAGCVLSLGSTLNMNGVAIGQSIGAIFVAQVYGIELSYAQMAIVTLVSLLSAIGAGGVPGTGIVMLSVVLHAMGLPLEGIALVAGVDHLREMVSTVVNVLGDGVAALFVAKRENQIDLQTYYAATWLD